LPRRHSPPRITIATTTIITTHTLKTIPGPKAAFCPGRATFFPFYDTRKRPESR